MEKIKCPNCNHEIDVDVLLKDELRQEYEEKLNSAKQVFAMKESSLKRKEEEFEANKAKANELFQQRLNARLEEERKTLTESIKSKLATESSFQIESLEKELKEKSGKIIELNEAKSEVARLIREKDELKSTIEADAQVKFNETLAVERERIRVSEESKNELKFKELQKKLEDQKELTAEMSRKQNMTSQQFQGEIQELAIEEYLAEKFPLDTIEEIKKGQRGGDCVQIVNTRSAQNCGTIYYESKRTKEWQNGWIEKFKADIRDRGANIGVLVTEVMPSELDRMGLKDGIWVCTFDEFKGLSGVLRESIIQVSLAIGSQENKGDKMFMLYDYLTGNSFRMQVEAIVEGFTSMRNNLESEKRAMARIWKEREKQLDKVITNTIDMHGSIKGIAGNAIQAVKSLELGEGINDIEEVETDNSIF